MGDTNSGVFDLEVVHPRMKAAAREAAAPYKNDKTFLSGLKRGSIPNADARNRLLNAWSSVVRKLLAERSKKGVTAAEFDGMPMMGRLHALSGTAWGFEKFIEQCHLALLGL